MLLYTWGYPFLFYITVWFIAFWCIDYRMVALFIINQLFISNRTCVGYLVVVGDNFGHIFFNRLVFTCFSLFRASFRFDYWLLTVPKARLFKYLHQFLLTSQYSPLLFLVWETAFWAWIFASVGLSNCWLPAAWCCLCPYCGPSLHWSSDIRIIFFKIVEYK
jgi:hypothetical protein